LTEIAPNYLIKKLAKNKKAIRENCLAKGFIFWETWFKMKRVKLA